MVLLEIPCDGKYILREGVIDKYVGKWDLWRTEYVACSWWSQSNHLSITFYSPSLSENFHSYFKSFQRVQIHYILCSHFLLTTDVGLPIQRSEPSFYFLPQIAVRNCRTYTQRQWMSSTYSSSLVSLHRMPLVSLHRNQQCRWSNHAICAANPGHSPTGSVSQG